jgi:hypothetical protein
VDPKFFYSTVKNKGILRGSSTVNFQKLDIIRFFPLGWPYINLFYIFKLTHTRGTLTLPRRYPYHLTPRKRVHKVKMTQNNCWAPTIFLYSSGPYQPMRTSFRLFSTLKSPEFHFSQNKYPSDAKIGKRGVLFLVRFLEITL